MPRATQLLKKAAAPLLLLPVSTKLGSFRRKGRDDTLCCFGRFLSALALTWLVPATRSLLRSVARHSQKRLQEVEASPSALTARLAGPMNTLAGRRRIVESCRWRRPPLMTTEKPMLFKQG